LVRVLETARLHWDAHGQPGSADFGDIYFSRADGLAESRAVFLAPNQIPLRWQNFAEPQFVVAELGFGTGLNFLATWEMFARQDYPFSLYFAAVEKYPLHHADLTRALALWPELEEYAQPLLNAYPPPQAGRHVMTFAQGRVWLDLYLM
jgi:tRNA 5-methylaminomethyl-2-thiouridine biosynthesis bifunctional protein